MSRKGLLELVREKDKCALLTFQRVHVLSATSHHRTAGSLQEYASETTPCEGRADIKPQ